MCLVHVGVLLFQIQVQTNRTKSVKLSNCTGCLVVADYIRINFLTNLYDV